MMKCFTVRKGNVKEGIAVENFELTSGVVIPAVLLGEQGRGRSLAVVPVEGVPAGERIYNARLGVTRSGRPKLIATDNTEDNVLVAFMESIGFRGGNHYEFPPEAQVVATGRIAQGDAGYVGAGEQHLVVLPNYARVRVGYSGRLYGAPRAYIYLVKGTAIYAVPEEHEDLLDELIEEVDHAD